MLHFFTSGSTGAPTAHRRRWDALALGGAAWREALALKGRGGIVATVPPQHMYGMEVSVVLPLTSPGIAVWNGQPLYPADVSKALDAITGLRVLATTPVHLSALVRSGIRLPPLHRIVSATSPLTPALARRAEGLWRVPVLDVYGSTETGMVATRRPAHSEIWRPRTDVSLSIDDDVSTVEAPHLDGRISLADRLERADGGFRLFRRNDDLVNVAGKRASLADLNGILQQLPGVTDGAFWMPDDSDPENFGRPVAFVVSDCLDAEAVRQGLRGRIADVFIPRRVIKVSSLPRNATGKLTRAAIDALWQRHNGHPDGDV